MKAGHSDKSNKQLFEQDAKWGRTASIFLENFAIDEGESDWARCTNEATTEVHVTEFGPEGKVYDAKVCAACAKRASAEEDGEPKPFSYKRRKVEIIKKRRTNNGPGTGRQKAIVLDRNGFGTRE